MTDKKTITEAQLHAFIDHELCDEEQNEILNLTNEDPALFKTVDEIRHDMDMVTMAYHNLPITKSISNSSAKKNRIQNRYPALAASLLLGLGSVSGWLIANHVDRNVSPSITMIDDFDPINLTADKILIHVNTLDDSKVTGALNKIEKILEESDKNQNHVKLEVVASAEGLFILRQGSPYANKITSLSKKYKNVEFLACGVAMEVAKLKEQNEINLLPEVEKIPAAVNEIIEKLGTGWVYSRL